MDTIKNNSIKLFFILVIIFTVMVNFVLVKTEAPVLYLILMWLPALAAIISNIYQSIACKEKLSIKKFLNGLGFKLCNVKYILLGIILPLIYLLIPYIIYWVIYPDNFAYSGVPIGLVLKDCLPAMIIGIFGSLISALGEEKVWQKGRQEQCFGNKITYITNCYSSLCL